MRILACGAHADDVELGCGGSLALAVAQGHEVAILDLTGGELGSNGDVAGRAREAEAAALALGVSLRENAGLPDGRLSAAAPEQRRALVSILRRLAPELVFIPCRDNRHPDHREAHQLLVDAVFFAGVRRFEAEGPPGRPRHVLQYMERYPFAPSLVLDTSSVIAQKRAALAAYGSQFERGAKAVPTLINRPDFLEQVLARDRYHGGMAGFAYGEAFLASEPLALQDFKVFQNRRGEEA